MIAQATLSESSLDRNRIRESLSALRLGHDGLEQFVGLLFDELESLREQLDEEQMRLDEQRHELREIEAQIAAERSQWETDRQHWHDALQKRVVELERDRLALTAELESERRRTSEMAQAAADQHRQFVVERAESAAELRALRQARTAEPEGGEEGIAGQDSGSRVEPGSGVRDEAPIDLVHAEEDALKVNLRRIEAETKHPAAEVVINPPSRPKAAPVNSYQADPVMGPLLSQFQQLQRDVARRREKKKSK
jgi:hypothetical protein